MKGGVMSTVEEFLEHHGVKGQKWGIRNERTSMGQSKKSSIQIDETPWSHYKASDYTPAQWHNASLIHEHPPGVPTNKNQCKLPIKTPSGIVNRHGVFAAAAVLAGSRGGVQATSEQKTSAANALLRIYGQMGADPPASLKLAKHSALSKFLSHHGVKGMHWGIRHDPRTGKVRSGKSSYSTSSEAKAAAKLRSRPVSSLSNQELKILNERRNLEQNYHRLNPSTIKKGENAAKKILEVGAMVGGAYALFNSPWGRKVLALGSRHAARQLRLPGFK
jgi:hypothetical protein